MSICQGCIGQKDAIWESGHLAKPGSLCNEKNCRLRHEREIPLQLPTAIQALRCNDIPLDVKIEVVAMRRSGLLIREISDKTGVALTSVSRICNYEGVGSHVRGRIAGVSPKCLVN